jgi:hypothetical protein
MVPLFMHLRVRSAGRRGFGLWFPVILIWVLLAALLIAVLPLLLLAALITASAGKGPGFALLLVYPLLASVLWNLGGLHVETKNARSEFLIVFP